MTSYILKCEVLIEADEAELLKKYANYNLNFTSCKHFVNNVADCFETTENYDLNKYGLEDNMGYSVKVLNRQLYKSQK